MQVTVTFTTILQSTISCVMNQNIHNIHPYVVPKLYDLHSSAEQKRRYFKEHLNCFCPYN